MPLLLLHRLLKLNIVIFVAISVALSGILASLMSIFLRGRITLAGGIAHDFNNLHSLGTDFIRYE